VASLACSARWPPSPRRGVFGRHRRRRAWPAAGSQAASRARAWAAGRAPAKLTLDFDATLVNLHSEKERLSLRTKRALATTRCWSTSTRRARPWPASSGRARRGQQGGRPRRAARCRRGPVAGQHQGRRPRSGVDVLVRADTAGAAHGFVDAIVAKHFEFSIGFDITEAVRLAITDVPPTPGRPRSPRTSKNGPRPGWQRSRVPWTFPPGGRHQGHLPQRRAPPRGQLQAVRP